MIQLLDVIARAPFCRGIMVIYLVFSVTFAILVIKELDLSECEFPVCITIGIGLIIIVLLLKGSSG